MHELSDFTQTAPKHQAHDEFAQAAIPSAPIQRRQRINMRDPQQAAMGDVSVSSFELPSFGHSTSEAGSEAQRIIAEAKATAEQMIAQARAMRDAELQAAREEGHAQGYEAGLEAADRDTAALIATAEAIAANVAKERDQLLAESEGEVVELALEIANKLVNAAIDVDPALVVDVCRGAMRKAFQRETLTVLAHPDDLEMLRSAGPAMAQELGGIHQLDFVEERRLQRGSVIVRTPVGEIDATFASKGEKIADALRELVEMRRSEAKRLRAA